MAQAIGGVDYLFQSTPPVRGATNDPDHAPNLWVFQSTPPVRGATDKALLNSRSRTISIHAPRAGGDRCCKAIAHKKPYFNPRPPCGGRLPFFVFVFLIMKFQSTPPVRGATSIRGGRKVACEISIHAPRAGGDCRGLVNASDFKTFQSTPPVRGATAGRLIISPVPAVFQSTPPVRGATLTCCPSGPRKAFQSTPPVRGATR